MPAPAPSAPDSPLRVAYVLKMFPRLSETFILNEILELERQGVEVSAYSLMLPDDGRFHGSLARLRLGVRYFPVEKPETLWQAIRDLPAGLAPPISRWQEAADFLGRHRIPKDLEMLLRAVLIAAQVRSAGVEHIHSHFATIAARMAALVSMLTGIPFSFTSHAKDIFRETVDRKIYAELVERAAFNITVTEYNRDYILEHTPGIDAAKIVRLYNGIDLELFRPAAARAPEPVPHIVSVGRLVDKKGFHLLLDALALWKREGRPFRATIIGDGEERARLERRRAELGLDGEVVFAGAQPQEEVRRISSQATMTVLACVPDAIGNQDALPTTLLESLALGVPIVSTTLSGIPEIVSDDAGILVPPGDASALAGAMTALAARIASGGFSPDASRRRAERLFDLRVNVAELRRRFGASAHARAAP